MASDRNTSEPAAGAPTPDPVDRAAAIDDFFGGFAAELPASASGLADDDVGLPGSLDLLLLLRQAATTATPPAAMPATIGRYRVIGLAGHGGFSVVWEAFDPVLRRRVAAKCCSPDALVSPTVRRRFRREAELASRLVHPHIVTIHEVGDDDGLDFITAEFCVGGSLAAWLARHPGPVDPLVAARIARAVALAAGHAHEAGIVHRDIKPANVMLVAADGHDSDAWIIPPEGVAESASPGMTVKLGDFGLGLQREARADDDPLTQLTADGARLGTPAWMAPEQLDRSFGEVGPATDVHAIGLLLDRMLTGRPLRAGGSTVETFREIMLEEPVSASRVHPTVSPDLAAVCLRCLAKQPAQRYESAAALADDLGRWLEGRPTLARPLTPTVRLARSIARRPLAWGLAAVAVVASIAAGWAFRQQALALGLAAAHEATLVQEHAADELLRGFAALRDGNVAAAQDQLDRAAALDPRLASSFAGRWLSRRTHGEGDVLLAAEPPADLHCIAVSPTGDVAAVGGADGRLWLLRDHDSSPSAASVEAHDEINDVCFSPDGRLIASAGQDGRLRWWRVDAARGRVDPAGEAERVAAPLYAACFAENGAAILYGGEDRVLRIVSLAEDAPPHEGHRFEPLAGFHQDIEAIALVTATTAVVAYGPTLSIVDTATGRRLQEFERGNLDEAPSVLHNLAVAPDRGRIVAAGSDRVPRIWDAASGRIVQTLPTHPDWVQACRFTPDGLGVVTACRDGVVRAFDATTGEPRAKLVGHRGRIWDIAFDGPGRPVSVGADGTARRWEISGDGRDVPLRSVPVSGGVAWGVVDADAGSQPRAIVLQHPGPLNVMTFAARPQVTTVPIDVGGSAAIAFDRTRQRIAIGFHPGAGRPTPLACELRDNGSVVPSVAPCASGHDLDRFVAWTADGRLVGCSSEGRIVAWTPQLDAVSEVGRVKVPTNISTSTARVITASPTLPPRIAACCMDGWIITLGDDGRPVGSPTPLALRGSVVTAVAWSPDGGLVACGMLDGGVHLFDTASGELVSSLMPHLRFVQDLAFAPDGRTLFTADNEHLRISDVVTLRTFDELVPDWRILALAVSADGRRVVVGGMGSLGVPANERARLAVLEVDAP
jgi:eukaryotic-like serine/threonine-protein kinase